MFSTKCFLLLLVSFLSFLHAKPMSKPTHYPSRYPSNHPSNAPTTIPAVITTNIQPDVTNNALENNNNDNIETSSKNNTTVYISIIIILFMLCIISVLILYWKLKKTSSQIKELGNPLMDGNSAEVLPGQSHPKIIIHDATDDEGKAIEMSKQENDNDNEIEHSANEGKLRIENNNNNNNNYNPMDPLPPFETNQLNMEHDYHNQDNHQDNNQIMIEDEEINLNMMKPIQNNNEIKDLKDIKHEQFQQMLQNGDVIMNSIENDILEHMSTSHELDNKTDIVNDNNVNHEQELSHHSNNNNDDNNQEEEIDDESIEISYPNNGNAANIPQSIIRDFRKASMSMTAQGDD